MLWLGNGEILLVLTFDTETTTFAKGNPFSRRNRLCAIGYCVDDGGVTTIPLEYDSRPYGPALREFIDLFAKADLLVGFNIKFDLHWIRRYLGGINLPDHTRVWDCQLGQFILSGQSEPYPSLDGTAEKYELGKKLDVVKTEYWEKGLDTPEVPWDILAEYLAQDVALTRKVYEKQQELLRGSQLALFKAQCYDLVVLEDCEFNGMLYDADKSLVEAKNGARELDEIDQTLRQVCATPDGFNFNSADHLSHLLYGGVCFIRTRVPTVRILKGGIVKNGEKWGFAEHVFPGMVAPPRGSETLPTKEWDDDTLNRTNEGRVAEGKRPIQRVYSTDAPTLKGLKGKKVKKIVELLLRRSEVEKLVSTYYLGLSELITEKDWPDNTIHGQFNQVVAATGRLSSSAPNLQNFAGDIKGLFYSRF